MSESRLPTPPVRHHGPWAGRISTGIAVGLVALLVVGFAYESVAGARAAARHEPPGVRVDVGGRHLHVHCVGDATGPTVVVEAGSGSWSNDWTAAQGVLAGEYRVCSYDRAGYGWSDPAPDPPSVERITSDLHRALDEVGVHAPFVLMGHSLGGLYARSYALRHPDDVRGLILVDARHEDATASLPDALAQQETRMAGVYRLARLLARFGVVRAVGPAVLPPSGLPEPYASVFWDQATAPRFFRTVAEEIAALGEVETRVRDSRHDVPVVIVRHGTADMFAGLPDAGEAERAWRALQEDLLRLSPRSTLLVAEGAGHNVHIEGPHALVRALAALEELSTPSGGEAGRP